MSAELAEELTGEPGAAMALLTLVRGNILTEAVGDLVRLLPRAPAAA